MKLYRYLFLFVFVASFNTLSAEETAETYMEYVMKDYRLVSVDVWQYMKSCKHANDIAPFASKRNSAVGNLMSAKKKLEGKGEFKTDALLHDALMRYYEAAINTLEQDYVNLEGLQKKWKENPTQMKLYFRRENELRDRILELNKKVGEEHTSWSHRYNIDVRADHTDLYQRMRVGEQAYDYYDAMYQANFQAIYEEERLVEVLKTKDPVQIEKSRVKLLNAAQKGKAEMGELGACKFDNKEDKRMLMPSNQLLDFYIKEANEIVPKQIEFFEAKNAFIKKDKAFRARKKKPTKSEVEEMKKEAYQLNKSQTEYNMTIKKANERRSYVVNVWNNDARNFIDKNVPK